MHALAGRVIVHGGSPFSQTIRRRVMESEARMRTARSFTLRGSAGFECVKKSDLYLEDMSRPLGVKE